jgi:hypothetical protein
MKINRNPFLPKLQLVPYAVAEGAALTGQQPRAKMADMKKMAE